MNNQLQVFNHPDFGALETIEIDGKVYFPATKCAAALGYAKPHNAVSQHCHDSLKQGVTDALGRTQETNFIPEGDVLRLIVNSKLPKAQEYERWVFDEVLPTIHRHGAYMTEVIAQMPVQRRVLCSDDYIRAAGIVSSCKSRYTQMTIVLHLLEQAGFSIPEVTSLQQPIDAAPAPLFVDNAEDVLGLPVADAYDAYVRRCREEGVQPLIKYNWGKHVRAKFGLGSKTTRTPHRGMARVYCRAYSQA